MATSTTRLALIKPAGNEARAVGPLNTNWDTIDEWMGCILVNDGVTPATADLFDGAIVKERTSGIIWEARKNGGGTFDKVYIRYPLQARAALDTPATPVASDTTIRSHSVASISGKNAVLSGGGRITIPIKGIYVITAQLSWSASATGFRLTCYNGATSGNSQAADLRPGHATHSCAPIITDNIVLNAGDNLTLAGWQTSTSTIAPNGGLLMVTMTDPVQ